MAAKKETKQQTGKAEAMTYESIRLPNTRMQLAAAARSEGKAVKVDDVLEDTGKEK